jgi:hypothetical protein
MHRHETFVGLRGKAASRSDGNFSRGRKGDTGSLQRNEKDDKRKNFKRKEGPTCGDSADRPSKTMKSASAPNKYIKPKDLE